MTLTAHVRSNSSINICIDVERYIHVDRFIKMGVIGTSLYVFVCMLLAFFNIVFRFVLVFQSAFNPLI